ncbi:MAG: DUF805 domain-containing protein [Muribaculaceae bacterium]|nr:DUF805 domain-containing protein [Muribaculaceae bacterium]
MKYFLVNNEQQSGPFELDELIENGLNENSFVWTESMPDWAPAMQVPEVAALLPQKQIAPSGFEPVDNAATPATSKNVGCIDALKICFSKFAVFEGRARRSEYWWFALWYYVISFFTCCLGNLVLLIPMIAVTFRRMHDTGRSGWWAGAYWAANILLIVLTELRMVITIPQSIISPTAMAVVTITIVVFIFALSDSQPGTNEYGPNPKD